MNPEFRPTKPQPLPVNAAGVPIEIRELKRWCCWKYILTDKGRWTKPPFQTNGAKADSTNAATWTDFYSALAAYQSGAFDGIGFMFDGSGFVGVDFDDAISGEKFARAEKWIKKFNSYAEESPSGKGYHIICKGKLPDSGHRDAGKGLEIYDSARFFCVTGNVFLNQPVTEAQAAVNEFLGEFFPPRQKPPATKPAPAHALTLSDSDLISKASTAKNGATFSALWRGDYAAAGHASHSEADAALLGALRFWTGGDKGRSFSLFSKSGLNRDKWEREDYRESTWELVASGEVYSPTRPTAPASSRNGIAGDYLPDEAEARELSEFDYANRLAAKLPKIKTVGSDWFAYSSGAWQKIHRATLRPLAQEILPPAIRTARRESTLLDHLEGRCQVTADSFRGFNLFDASGDILLNAANGIVRVSVNQSPELLPHDDSHLFTCRLAANFNPQASADLFQKTLCELLPDELDRDLLQLCFGNFLLPDCRFEAALVCYGEAGNGKSTIADPVSAALGSDLVARLSMSQICDPRSYHLPKLKFAAVNLGTELDVIAIDESANFKTIVSGEPVEARPIYGEPFTMQTVCKLWFLANGLPRFKNGTEAELRRTRFIRFDRRPEVKDVTLKSRLLAERDGVFNFMLAGLQRLLTVPEIPLGGAESQAVHARFKVSNDPLGTFIAQHCQFDVESREPKAALKESFDGFCETHGLPVQFGDWFFKRLYERFTNLKEIRAGISGDRVRCVAGIRLKTMLETD